MAFLLHTGVWGVPCVLLCYMLHRVTYGIAVVLVFVVHSRASKVGCVVHNMLEKKRIKLLGAQICPIHFNAPPCSVLPVHHTTWNTR